MRKLLKSKVVRSLGIYSLSNVANSAIPFLLLPILTRYLAPADYGKLSNYVSIISLLLPFVSLNLMSSLQVVFVKRHEELASYVSTGFLAMLGLTALFSVVLLVFATTIEAYVGVPVKFIYFAAIYALYQNVFEVLLSIWRMEDRALNYGALRIARTAAELGMALLFVVGFKWSFEGSLYALIYSYGAGALFTLFVLFKKGLFVKELSFEHLKHLFRYGAPLIPHVLGGVMIVYADKLVLTAYHGLAANGIYSVGFMVGQVIGLIQNSFNQAWVPWVFQKIKEDNEKDKAKIVKWTYRYFVILLLLSFVFYLFCPLIFSFLGKSYSQGIELVLYIALGFAFNGMYKMVSVYFFYFEKTMEIAIISICTAGLNVVLILLWVPKYNFFGAAFAMMISFFIQFVATWIWSTKIISMPWKIKFRNED